MNLRTPELSLVLVSNWLRGTRLRNYRPKDRGPGCFAGYCWSDRGIRSWIEGCTGSSLRRCKHVHPCCVLRCPRNQGYAKLYGQEWMEMRLHTHEHSTDFSKQLLFQKGSRDGSHETSAINGCPNTQSRPGYSHLPPDHRLRASEDILRSA